MNKHWVMVGMLAASLVATSAAAQNQAPNRQPTTAAAPTAPTGELSLGTVRIPHAVTADGKPLPAGTYQLKLTAQSAAPAVGTSQVLERWVEFSQNGAVKGREIVSIIPEDEAKLVIKGTAPANNASKVQTLKGNYFLRVWVHKAGNHFLIHLPIEGATATN